ncbi:MAG TPA: ADOP family duplicated permease [Vicinamibacterales bacterium]|nr:ADOP family duplicated permease [Vicinamibacterales bacterium]
MGILGDAHHAARLLIRQPRFTLLTVLTMALGIGATTTLFSVTYGVLMKPLPWPNGDRVVLLKETRGGSPPRFGSFTNTAYVAWRDHASTIEDLAAWSQATVTLSGVGEPDRIRIAQNTASLFRVLGARPMVGSLFAEKDETDKPSVVILSESLWRQRFGGDQQAVGRIVRLDGAPHTIVGVLPDDLAFPDRRTRAWVPYRVHPVDGNYLSLFSAVAKLRPGATAVQAAAEGTARGEFVADTGMTTTAIFGSNGPVLISAVQLKDAMTSDVRQPLTVLLAAVLLLLLTAVANIAGLQLARATARRREMAIRAALGAGHADVVRQLLAESLLLGLVGGAAGLVLAWWLHRLLPSVLPSDFPRVDGVVLDATVIAGALVVSIGASVVFSLMPAIHLRRLNLATPLSEDGSAPVGVGDATGVGRMRRAMIAAQVAIACVLLVGASLLGRSFLLLLNADRGFNPSGILTARVFLPGSIYSPEKRYAIVRGILDRVTSINNATNAAFTSELPVTAGGSTAAFSLRNADAVITAQASPRLVSPGAFAALGMRIVDGRDFNELDTEAASPVAIVNRAFARRYLGGAAVGARLPMGVGYQDPTREATIVGVVDDVRYITATTTSMPELYYSYRQFGRLLPVPSVTFLIRTSGDPRALTASLRTAIREADDTLVPDAIATMEDRLLTGLARPRLYMILFGGFAAFALIIVSVGLFAVLWQTVAQRSREIAVRSALGAQRLDILRLVARQGLAITAAGLIAGVAGAAALAGSMATFLYGVTPYDGLTYVLVPMLLLVVSTIACLGPALRAMRVDPVRVLRGQ